MGGPDFYRKNVVTGSEMAESCDSSDDGAKWYYDFKWSRSLSERVRGIRDSTLNRVWKKFREHKLAGNMLFTVCSSVFNLALDRSPLFMTQRSHLFIYRTTYHLSYKNVDIVIKYIGPVCVFRYF